VTGVQTCALPISCPLNTNGRECRFIIDVVKKHFYAWGYELLHHYVAKDLGFPYPDHDGNYIYGAAGLHGSKLGEIIFIDLNETPKAKIDKIKSLGWTKTWFGDTLNSWIEDNLKIKID